MIKMKYTILALLTSILLIGCTEAGSKTDPWEGWTRQAGELARHYDEQLGVACYQSTRSGGNYRPQLSCVKVK